MGQEVNYKAAGVASTTLSAATSDSDLWFYGAAAYNYLPEELDRICEELYSNRTCGEARSMKIEDVNNVLNFTPLGGLYGTSDNVCHTPGNLTTKIKDIEIWNSIKEAGTYTPDGANTEEALGEYKLD